MSHDDPDAPEEPPTIESLLEDRVALELQLADLKEEMQDLEDEVKDLLWQIRYRLGQNDISYALDLIDRWK